MRRLLPLPRIAARLASAAGLFAAGLAAGWVLRAAVAARTEPPAALEPTRLIRGEDSGRWQFINPLLECETAEEYLRRPELEISQARVREFVVRRIREGQIADASVYFRQLHDGPWFGINLRDEYAPASLLKLPTLIAILKRAEVDPSLLSRKLTYDSPDDLNRLMLFQPADPLRRGRSYTVEELCRRMVSYSDNNAASLLSSLVSEAELDRVLLGLGVLGELEHTGGNLNIKSLSGFFRVLYNASILSDEMSELALEMLSRSAYREGILAGVPPDVPVCSKYGEAWVSPRLHQLHEFAIVFHRDRPYLLGVMTKGADFRAMRAFARDLSLLIYEAADSAQLHAAPPLVPPGAP